MAISPEHDSASCFVYYAPLATSNMGTEPSVVFEGHLSELSSLYETYEYDASPTNIWPPDRSWFVYTDCDLMATQVSGSDELVARLVADHVLETLKYP